MNNTTTQDIMQDAINSISREIASKKEKIIKALLPLGLNPKDCFFDENDNLVILTSKMNQGPKLKPKANLGCATTKQLIDEVVTRIEIQAPGLLNYRTVDYK